MKRVIVFGNGDSALSAIRGLAAEGLRVIHLYTQRGEPAHFSRFVWKRIRVPSPLREGEKLLDVLLSLGDRWGGTLLIPSNDATVEFTSRHRDVLASKFVCGVGPWDIVGRILNKRPLYEQARRIGIPMPRTLFPDSVEALRAGMKDVLFPCMLKPHESHLFFEAYGRKLTIVHDEQELIDAFTDAHERGLGVMVCEIIPGPDSRICHYRTYIDREGRVLFEMATQKFRQKPPSFGVSCLARTIPVIPRTRELGRKLVQSFSYTGISSVEFKYDERDGQYKLMEVNIRVVLPETLLIASGVNFSHMTYQEFVEGVRPSAQYRPNVYWVHNFLELYRLLFYRNLSMRDFLQPYRKNPVVCIPFWNDPLAFMAKACEIPVRMWQALRRALR